jgi:hypothetical protein
MRVKSSIFGSLLASVVVAGLLVSTVSAQVSNSIKFSPPVIEDTLAPGATKSYEVRIENGSADPLSLDVTPNDFVASDDEKGTPKILLNDNDRPSTSIKGLISVQKEVLIAPGKSERVPVTLNIPANASPGSYFGIVRFTSKGSGKGQVALSASTGPLMIIRVTGKATEVLKVVKVGALTGADGQEKFVARLNSSPTKVGIRVKNEGNVHLKPVGSAIVKNMFGKQVASVEKLNASGGNVLPGTNRIYVANLGKKLPIGRYTIESKLLYGEGGGSEVNASSTFWVLPLVPALIGGLILVLGLGLLVRSVKAYNKAIVKKAKRRGA